MDCLLAVLRPKTHGAVSRDFHPENYDIMLSDFKSGKSTRSLKQLPKTIVSFEQDPADVILTFLYNLTGAEYGGLKARRAVFIPPAASESSGESVTSQGTLYCLPVHYRDKLNPAFVDRLPTEPGFYSLQKVMDCNPEVYTKQTRIMLPRLRSWLTEKHKVPGAIDVLFSTCAEERLKRSITNPAYFDSSQTELVMSQIGEVVKKSIANEVLAKMMAIEKCDKTTMNPMFRSGPGIKRKVDGSAVNPYWGRGRPDLSKIAGTSSTSSLPFGNREWDIEYPLHKAAIDGDARLVKNLIKDGQPVLKKDTRQWTAMHYAASRGRLEVIQVLLYEGDCSPNILTDKNQTPLHIASLHGRVYVIELLLNHPEIDVNALDSSNKTALDLCDKNDQADWQASAKLLQSAASRPAPKIQVFLMDGTYQMLDLVSGANTTVHQLHSQMTQLLNIPRQCEHFFTIWICSRNLQVQLKTDHKPIQHLNDWKRKIVGMLTDKDPSREDPKCFWRRDAMLSIDEERKVSTKVKNPVAISLLFHEALHNYLNSFCPCADQDVIILGGILMQLNHSDFDQRKMKNFFNNSSAIHQLVPHEKLNSNKKINWPNKILAQYKHYSQTMSSRDRSTHVLHQHFLKMCWNLIVYGSAFFTGYVQIKANRTPTTVYIGVNDIGAHIIDTQSKVMLSSFGYKDITWQVPTPNVLEIKLKGAQNGGMSILTKQAGLLDHLMGKLSNINLGPEH